ncbi:uncharacterized protein [Osmerus mordax]|uniref:uncharacterized protein n=1 Tax=Osmerus mordax TaxID=8014 RepID=UPI00350F01E3
MGFFINECVNNNTNSTTPLDWLAQIIGWVTFAVGLPAIGLAIYALKHMPKGRNGLPFHIISLLVSDIFNFIGRSQVSTQSVISPDMSMLILYFGVVSNITFMVCIAQERHLQTAWPQCQGFFTRVKSTALFSMVMWAAPFAILALAVLKYYFWFAVTLLLPRKNHLMGTIMAEVSGGAGMQAARGRVCVSLLAEWSRAGFGG